MPLESTMICLDNSEWMRNGDYQPSRLEAQQDAASLICNDRTRGNPENTVGVLSMAGQGVELLVSPTEDASKVLACFARVAIGGTSVLSTSVQIAQLALKHRKNKNGGQRIIAFVGSPIQEEMPVLQKIGKQLKKNNVAIDVINMGEVEENNEKLQKFVEAVNSNDNSHLISIPAGVQPLDAINASPILHMGGNAFGGGAVGGAGGAGGNFDEYGGIDPAMDPELAMAIRVSTEEARANEEARAAQGATTGGSTDTPAAAAAPAEFGGPAAADEDDEEALMQRALELSMLDMNSEGGAPAPAPASEEAPAPTSAAATTEVPTEAATMDVDEDDEAMRLALEMSMSAGAAPASAPADASASAPAAAPAGAPGTGEFLDPEFVQQLLGSVDVDMNDPLIQAALAQLGNSGGAEGKDGGDGKKPDEKK